MQLYIDTTKNNNQEIELKLKKGSRIIAVKEVNALYSQAEKLLVSVDCLLKDVNLDLRDLTEIYVKNSGGSFTALRIGVITANALGYALGIKILCSSKKYASQFNNFNIIRPRYSKEPSITIKTK
ncbi:hypothetical protein DRH27_03200 [Candidatus Falkowbacteria bacterium]|nr:MAG: hypothetical protein DRH27_03200 [Candidatus Falkowbacteria bacterium]